MKVPRRRTRGRVAGRYPIYVRSPSRAPTPSQMNPPSGLVSVVTDNPGAY